MGPSAYFGGFTLTKFKTSMILLVCLFSVPGLTTTDDNEVTVLNDRPIIGMTESFIRTCRKETDKYKYPYIRTRTPNFARLNELCVTITPMKTYENFLLFCSHLCSVCPPWIVNSGFQVYFLKKFQRAGLNWRVIKVIYLHRMSNSSKEQGLKWFLFGMQQQDLSFYHFDLIFMR